MHARWLIGAVLMAMLCRAGSAQAAIIIVDLPEFEGTFHGADETFPLAPITVGTFVYDIPDGEAIDGASLTGKFGNSKGGNTAPLDLFFDDLLVAGCSPGGSCDDGLPEESFGFNFGKAQFTYVEQKENPLRAVQTGPGTMRLGPSRLTISTTIPEPSSLVLLGAGLGLAIRRRRRSMSPTAS